MVALIGATDGLVTDWLAGERRSSPAGMVETLLTVFGPTLAETGQAAPRPEGRGARRR